MSAPDLSSLPKRMRYAADVLKEATKADFCKTLVWHPDSLRRVADRLDPAVVVGVEPAEEKQ